MTGKARPSDSKREGLGLPETLRFIQYEKCAATISAKVEPSLKRYILEHGGSSFIRTLVMQALSDVQTWPTLQ
jgi:hypothetical protein